ncbi:MAG: TlpA disulfide reductase family protein [Agriterribacter sp.]
MIRIVLISVALLVYHFTNAQQHQSLPPGMWRGVLQRSDGKEIAFNFESKEQAGKTKIYVLNAAERLAVDDIRYEGDSIIIKLPFFDSQFRAVLVNKKQLQGFWTKRLAERDVVLSFTATHNESFRYNTTQAKPSRQITGRWKADFTDTITHRSLLHIGVFEQKGSRLTGSFLTASGDYRYLQGIVDGDSLKLSGFDGGFALLFTAKIDNDSTISGGRYYSGAGAAPQVWTAQKNKYVQLPDSAVSGKLKAGASPKVDFTFNDADGKPVSFSDKKFKGKVVILQILGSWCPNCMDESTFMGEVYRSYKAKGVEIIGLAYERTTDVARSQAAVKNFMKRLNVAYPVLIPAVAVGDPQRSEKTLPQLERIPAFPTTIFVDRKGEIQKIHSGFSGPATGAADYEEQKKEYYQIINDLLAR